MHSFHSSSLSFGIAFCVCEPKGDKGCVLRLSNTRRGNTAWHEPDRTLRIDYGRPEWNNLGEGIVSGTELQVSTVQVLKAVTSERRSFLEAALTHPLNYSFSVSCASAAELQTRTASRWILTIPNLCHRLSKRLIVD
jgi:hypothetical protein